MGLEESVQHVVMGAIQELMTKEVPSHSPHSEGYAEMESQLKRTGAEKDEAMQRCHELDQQVTEIWFDQMIWLIYCPSHGNILLIGFKTDNECIQLIQYAIVTLQ